MCWKQSDWQNWNEGTMDGRNNAHILKGNKNQTKQGTQKIILLIKAHITQFFKHF